MVSNLQVRPKESEEGEKASQQDGLQALAATAERREQRHQVSEQARGSSPRRQLQEGRNLSQAQVGYALN